MHSVYTSDELEFALAMDKFKRQAGKPFPDCRDVLLVARALGYRRVCPPEPKNK